MIPVDGMTPWLERALDLSSKRGGLLSSNLANVDTPGYVPTDLDFDDSLRAELQHRAHFGPMPGDPLPTPDYSVSPNLDGNQVDLDLEITRAMANKVFFDLGTEVLNRNFGLMRYAIDEGSR
ncbi:MAG: flagellar basal body rod protein FlgB [Myxococcota bacterium]